MKLMVMKTHEIHGYYQSTKTVNVLKKTEKKTTYIYGFWFFFGGWFILFDFFFILPIPMISYFLNTVDVITYFINTFDGNELCRIETRLAPCYAHF